tara:strand:- start:170 stop:553 length:384 start_codon:yes stop_codon:yes gene_type:complete
MLTITKRERIIEEFHRVKFPSSFGINKKVVKFKVPGEVLKEEFEFLIEQELNLFCNTKNYKILDWDCVYNDECFTVLNLDLEAIHSHEMLNNLFFLKKLFDDLNNMHGTEEYEERFSEVIKKVIANP